MIPGALFVVCINYGPMLYPASDEHLVDQYQIPAPLLFTWPSEYRITYCFNANSQSNLLDDILSNAHNSVTI